MPVRGESLKTEPRLTSSADFRYTTRLFRLDRASLAARTVRKERKDKMPKMKTKKCAVKRMKLSKEGKVLRSQGGHAHLNNGKKRNRKNNLCGRTTVDSLKVTKTYARALQGR